MASTYCSSSLPGYAMHRTCWSDPEDQYVGGVELGCIDELEKALLRAVDVTCVEKSRTRLASFREEHLRRGTDPLSH
jgi:hypothetical protein